MELEKKTTIEQVHLKRIQELEELLKAQKDEAKEKGKGHQKELQDLKTEKEK